MHAAVEPALVLMWNGRFDQAKAAYFQRRDSDAREALEYGYLCLLERGLRNPKDLKQRALEDFGRVVKLAEAAKAAATTEAAALEARIVYADALLIYAFLRLATGSYLSGCYNVRKSWKLFEELHEHVADYAAHPELVHCIKFGAGLFLLLISMLPASVVPWIRLIGFSADRELGLRLLHECWANPTFLRCGHAGVFLATAYLFNPTGMEDRSKNLECAEEVIAKGTGRYATSAIFQLLNGFLCRRRGQIPDGLAAVTRAVEYSERAHVCRFFLGSMHFFNLDWANALTAFEQALDGWDEMPGTCEYAIAQCHAMLGRQAEALAHLQRAVSRANPKSKSDTASSKYSKHLLQRPDEIHIAALYGIYRRRDHESYQLADLQRYGAAVDAVAAGHPAFHTVPALNALFLLLQGVVFYQQKRLAEAEANFQRIVDQQEVLLATRELSLKYAYYELGLTQFHRGNLDGAKQLFETGQALKTETFGMQSVSHRFALALRHLGEEVAPAEEGDDDLAKAAAHASDCAEEEVREDEAHAAADA